ncbi:IclR family transcriptional regulator [Nocardioides sp. AE5]|uniref:IclR family transcriptional regulator n=1 Tax=Nocardioides sp. AE5 TaxID=2962573 RepID=UPI00288120B0|nr:IclR family transcriptional regulator [Nocardioides sp. AE5]MDT0202714.1 IclR family transcriptional regulator [Nocardioides sp. AE5]
MTDTAIRPTATAIGPGAEGAAASRPGMIERLTEVLDVFIDGPDHLMLEDIVAASGLPKSTAFRMLRQLIELDWLEHDQRGYRLGPRMQRLGQRVVDQSALRAAAADVLNRLHLASSAVVHLVVLEGNKVHYLDKVGGAASLSVPSRVGVRLPAHVSVAGLTLLSALRPEQVDRLYAGTYIPEQRLHRLHEQLAAIRSRNGLALTPHDMRTPIRAVAAPVITDHGPVAAISCAVRGPDAPVEAFVPMVTHAARRTADRLRSA